MVGTTQSTGAESQSTQLLDFVLGRAEPPQTTNNGKNNEDLYATGSGIACHASTDSPAEDNEVPRGVQGVQRNVGRSTARPGTSFKAPLAPSKDSGGNGNRVSPIKPVVNASPDHQLPPPFITSTPKQQIRPPKHPSSPPSQDSFAGTPVSQNPAYYLATAKQFAIPIDQLGRSDGQGKESDSQTSSVELSDMQPRRLGNTLGQSLLSDCTSGPQSGSDDSGKILVAGSESSQTQSQSSGSEGTSFSQQLQSIIASTTSRTSTNDHIAITGASTSPIVINNPMSANFEQVTSQEATQPVDDEPFFMRRRRAGVVPATATTVATANESTEALVSPVPVEAIPIQASHCHVLSNSAPLSEASQVANAGSDKTNSSMEASKQGNQEVKTGNVVKPISMEKVAEKVVIPATDSESEDQDHGSKAEGEVKLVEEPTPQTPKGKSRAIRAGRAESEGLRRTGPSKIKPSKDDYVVPATSSPVKPSPVTPRRAYGARNSPSVRCPTSKAPRQSSVLDANAASGESDAESDAEVEPHSKRVVRRGKGKNATSSPSKHKSGNAPAEQPVERASSLQHIATPVSTRCGTSARPPARPARPAEVAHQHV